MIDHGLSQATELFKCLLVLAKTSLLSALQTPSEGIVVLANYCSEISLDERTSVDEDTRIKQVQMSKVGYAHIGNLHLVLFSWVCREY